MTTTLFFNDLWENYTDRPSFITNRFALALRRGISFPQFRVIDEMLE